MKTAHDRLNEIQAMLCKKWPAAFGQYQPLAEGCHTEVIAAFPKLPERELLRALNAWTHHPAYLRSVITKPFRINLDGSVVGEVNEQDREYACAQYHRYLQRQRMRKSDHESNERGYAILHEKTG